MKDYFNKDERVEMLFLKKYIDNATDMVEEWDKKGNLTKEEKKALKTAATWGLKAFNSIADRQSSQTLKTFWNSIKNAYINIQDKFAVDMYQKKMSSKMQDCYELNKDYYKLAECIFSECCHNCTKDHKLCSLAEEFEAHCMPEPTPAEFNNCRYAYTLDEVIGGKK